MQMKIQMMMTKLAKPLASVPILATIFFAFSLPVVAKEAGILPFTATYDFFRKGDKLGEGHRTLSKNKDGTYSLVLKSKLEWLIFSDERSEKSHFTVQDDDVTPISYHYTRSGTGTDKFFMAKFNPDHSFEFEVDNVNYPSVKEWQPGLLDELTLRYKIQADLIAGKRFFEYDVISKKGAIKHYRLKVDGTEKIVTALGVSDAIRVVRVYPETKKHALHAWFIPELNYTLARLWRVKNGVEQFDLVISRYQVD